MEESRYRLDDFELYQLARASRRKAYRLIGLFPPAEKYCLAVQCAEQRYQSQIISRRDTVGGITRKTSIFAAFLAAQSVSYSMIFNVCDDENYGNPGLVAELRTDAYTLIRRINGYIAYLRSKQDKIAE
jgi:hypothetical protein